MVNYGLGRRHKSKESSSGSSGGRKESLSSLRATNASMASSSASVSSLSDALTDGDAAFSNDPYFHFSSDQQDALLEESRSTATALIVDTLSGFDKWRFLTMTSKVQLFELKEDAADRVSAMRTDDPQLALTQSHTLLGIMRVRAKLDDFMRIVATDKRDKFQNFLTCLHEEEVQHADVFTAFGSLNSGGAGSHNNSSSDLLSSSFTSNSSFSSSRGPKTSNAVDVEQYAIKYFSLKEPKVAKSKSTRSGMTKKFIRKGKSARGSQSSASSGDSGGLTLCVGEYATIRQGKIRSSSHQKSGSGGGGRAIDDHRIGIIACHSVGDPQVTRYCKPIASTTGSGFAVTTRSFAQFSGVVVYPVESSVPGESLLEVVVKLSCFDPQGVSSLKKQAMMQYLVAYRHLENALLVLRLHDSPYLSSSTWVKSESRKCCNVCQHGFQFGRRKHHCRLCGEVICSKCSAVHTIKMAKAGKCSFRICDACVHGAGDSIQRLKSNSGPEREEEDEDEEEEVVEVDSELQPIRREPQVQDSEQVQQHKQLEPQEDEPVQVQQEQRRVPSVRKAEPEQQRRVASVRKQEAETQQSELPVHPKQQQQGPLREPSIREIQQLQQQQEQQEQEPEQIREPSVREQQKSVELPERDEPQVQVQVQVQHQSLLHKQQLEQHDSRHQRHDKEREKAVAQQVQDKQRAESTASSGESEFNDSRGFQSSNVTATTAASTPPSATPSPMSSSPASPSAALVHSNDLLYDPQESSNSSDRFSEQSFRDFHDSEYALDLSDLHLESTIKESTVFAIDEEEFEEEPVTRGIKSINASSSSSKNPKAYVTSYTGLEEEDDEDDEIDYDDEDEDDDDTGYEFHDSEVGINFSFEDIEEFNDAKYEALEALEEIQEITTQSAAMVQRNRLLDELRRTRLMDYDILDSAREQSFDLIATQAAQFMSCSLSSISFVDDRREFVKAAAGHLMLRVAGGSGNIHELPKQHSLAAHIVQRCAAEDLDMVLVLDARHDEVLSTNLFVYNAPYLRFVVGIPVRTRDGVVLGALVVADDRPRGDMTPTESKVLRDFAEQISELMEERWQRRMYQRRAAPAPEQIQQTLQSLLSQSYHTGQQLRQQQTERQNFHRSMPLPRQHQPRYQQAPPPRHQPRYQQQQQQSTRQPHVPQYQSMRQQPEPEVHGRLTMQGIEL